MSDVSDLNERLRKLQKVYDDIKEVMLGEDWETQMELRHLLSKVRDEIKICCESLQSLTLV